MAFWKRDGFFGLIVSLAFVVVSGSDLLQSLERKAYDVGVRFSTRTPDDNIAIVAIDDQSIANIGRWPWPRNIHARMIDLLGQAKTVGYTVFFVEPQLDPGLDHINRLLSFYADSSLNQDQKNKTGDKLMTGQPKPSTASALTTRLIEDAATLGNLLITAQSQLDTDTLLRQSIEKSANVVLAMSAALGEPQGRPDGALPASIVANSITKVGGEGQFNAGALPIPSTALLTPIGDLASVASGIGHLNLLQDVDGGTRTLPLVIRYYDHFLPSLALVLAAKSLNLAPADIELQLGNGVQIGGLSVPTDPILRMRPFFYTGSQDKPTFAIDSFFDVLSGKISPQKYRGKIVLVGATATGVGTNQVTPVSASMAPVVTLAHIVSSILNQDFIATPSWVNMAQWLAFAMIALYLIFLLPRISASHAGTLTAILALLLVGTHFYAITQYAIWVQLMVPLALLLSGHLLLTTKRFLLTEKGKIAADASSAESNRMLGLTFQNQGQLDAAYEKFRKVPLDDSMMEVLYNLGLDFERKRQFAKAAGTFEYLSKHDARFRDTPERIKRNRNLSETVILGGGRSGGAQSTLLLDKGDVQKPMLGRYQVEKELGKGAMGVVYQGKDPKINRVVAIKTLALSEEFEASELEEVKARFFREAETAGRLSHPNIVTIYDAGEEHDLAYIAMELLHGQDLAPFTKPGNLLPIAKVMDITLHIAEALAYAHSHQIVHRDIKPANIMYEPKNNAIKVTDFGIARITDASRTKTGVILGTPSYMSPEQLMGKKVDGRSDLFSLGVMFYQMLCGKLPFSGDSLATLTYKIANEPPPPISGLRPELPACIGRIIDRCLEKPLEKRYQKADELVSELRRCIQA